MLFRVYHESDLRLIMLSASKILFDLLHILTDLCDKIMQKQRHIFSEFSN